VVLCSSPMRLRGAWLGALGAAWVVGIPARIEAQPTPPPDGIAVGEFWFRPRLELRVRGEFHHRPVERSAFDVGILGSRLGTPAPMTHQWVAHERARLGLEVERGVLSATVVVQDARIAGFPSPLLADSNGDRPSTKFHTAYLEAHTTELRPSFARLGRQEIAWGEGRLIGTSDWLLVPRSLDAVRARWVVRQLDVEAFAALLTAPASVPPQYARQATTPSTTGLTGTGVQLYGVNTTLHLEPLLHFELSGLARIARTPLPPTLLPSDTYVIDGRVFGERAGWSYAAEFAYEFGRLALADRRPSIAAWGATAHVDWQTTWMLRPKLSLSGSYATGDDGSNPGTLRAFDPILPDARSGLGQMGLFAWSNILDAAFTVVAAPTDETRVTLGYRYLRLANPRGAWFSASLAPVGQNLQNDAAFLGHELDGAVSFTPLDSLTIRAIYGALITGAGARAILNGTGGAGPRLLSAAFLQVEVVAP
jgi:hypothetical protein